MERDMYSKIIAKLKEVSDKINGIASEAESIGDLDSLETVSKTNLVSAINEVNEAVGGAVSDISTINSSLSQFSTVLEYDSTKTNSDYPSGIFPFMIPQGTTIEGLTLESNARGIAFNGTAMHFFVNFASGGAGYFGGYTGGWHLRSIDFTIGS